MNYTKKDKVYKFINLMKIPLHQTSAWKTKSLWIIRNWQTKRNRTFIINVLMAYRYYPLEIENACREILELWKQELTIKIRTNKKNVFQYGNHIRIALSISVNFI
jgi:hypothetical protein